MLAVSILGSLVFVLVFLSCRASLEGFRQGGRLDQLGSGGNQEAEGHHGGFVFPTGFVNVDQYGKRLTSLPCRQPLEGLRVKDVLAQAILFSTRASQLYPI